MNALAGMNWGTEPDFPRAGAGISAAEARPHKVSAFAVSATGRVSVQLV